MEHEKVVITRGERSDLPVIVAVHSTALGQAAGGCRMWHYPTWQDGLADALRLSEAMTLKSSLAGLSLGGGKSVIALPPGHQLSADQRRAVMLDLGDVVESLAGSYGVAEDVGTTAEDMAVVAERTRFAYCLPAAQGGSGEPSAPTAVGVHQAIRATCAQLYGDPSPAGRRFTLVGVGQVGSRLARLLADDGASLTLSDVDASKQLLASELGAAWGDPAEAMFGETDVLVPAALGGVFTAEVVGRLRCRAVVGPANNQLVSEDVADAFGEHGVLWAPDFVVNSGGVIFGSLVDAQHVAPDVAMAKVEQIGATLAHVYADADSRGVTPYAAAVGLARQRVAAADAARRGAVVSA